MSVLCEENGKLYVAENPEDCEVHKYHIDGNILTTGKKCDYLVTVITDNFKNAFFVELKQIYREGDISHAMEQLYETAVRLYEELREFTFYFRLVYLPNNETVSKSLPYNKILQLTKKLHSNKNKWRSSKGSVVWESSGTYIENISENPPIRLSLHTRHT